MKECGWEVLPWQQGDRAFQVWESKWIFQHTQNAQLWFCPSSEQLLGLWGGIPGLKQHLAPGSCYIMAKVKHKEQLSKSQRNSNWWSGQHLQHKFTLLNFAVDPLRLRITYKNLTPVLFWNKMFNITFPSTGYICNTYAMEAPYSQYCLPKTNSKK